MSHFLGMSNASIIKLRFYSLLSILRQSELLCVCIGVHFVLHMLDHIRNRISRHPVLTEFLSSGPDLFPVVQFGWDVNVIGYMFRQKGHQIFRQLPGALQIADDDL